MTRRIRFTGTCFAVLAMLLHALVPVGWMPNTTGSGATFITICTMNGPVRMAMGADWPPVKKQQPNHDGNQQHQVCPFAAAPHFATPTNAVALLSNPSFATADRQAGYFDLIESPAAHSPQAPRAPPHNIV